MDVTSSKASKRSEPDGFPTRNYLVLVAVVALIGGFYFFCATQPEARWVLREPDGYYNLLADAFRNGQLHLKLEPHPNLLRLPDPYDPVANAPYRVHDLTLYRGHYYLYYGIVPELVLNYPWFLLTGTFLSDAFVVPFYGCLGVVMAAWVLVILWQRHFPGIQWPLPAAGLLALGLGTMLPVLMQAPSFYAVPISCAFACSMAAIVSLLKALKTPSPGRWLLLASLALGLGMGARPNFVLAAGLSFAPVLAWLIWFAPNARGLRSWRAAAAWGFCAYGPLFIMGCGLLGYNYLRFGSPFEFGVRYQLAGESQMQMVYYGPRWLLSGIQHYLFNPIHLTPYFPFVIPDGWIGGGMLWGQTVVWLAVGAVGWRRVREAAQLGVSFALLGAMGLANFLMVCLHFTRTERYMVDFQPALVLAGIFGGFCLWSWSERRRAMRRVVAGMLLTTVVASVAIGLGYSASRALDPGSFVGFARLLTYPTWLGERLLKHEHGPLELEVTFSRQPIASAEPLVSAGVTTSATDLVCVEPGEPGQVRFRFYHAGIGGPVSEAIAIEPEKPYRMRVQFGALLPPLTHPLYTGWNSRSAMIARRTVWVEFEGRRILDAVVAPYDSRPGDLEIAGLRHRLNDPIAMRFSGRVRLLRREPLTSDLFAEPALPGERAMNLSVALPFSPSPTQPLVATGHERAGDMLYAEFPTPGRIRFRFLHTGYGGPVSEEFPYVTGQLHALCVWFGSFASSETAIGRERLYVSFDDKTVFDQPQEFYPAMPEGVVFGRDALKSGVTEPFADVRLLAVETQRYEALPPGDWGQGYGAVRLRVEFPPTPRFDNEPLVVTGRSGAGDFVFVRYEGGGRVRFGADHWGSGGSIGDSVELDFTRTHVLEITLGSLYAKAVIERDVQPSLGSRTEVRLDGRLVFADRVPANSSEAARITFGRNLIGGSSCGPQFSGKILHVERLDLPDWPLADGSR